MTFIILFNTISYFINWFMIQLNYLLRTIMHVQSKYIKIVVHCGYKTDYVTGVTTDIIKIPEGETMYGSEQQ